MTEIPYGNDAASPTPSPEPGAEQKPAWQPWAKATPANPYPGALVQADAVDYSFSTYQTPKLAKLIYILATIVAAVLWLSRAIIPLAAGIHAHSLDATTGGGEITIGILILVFGWIPALLGLLLIRVALEAALALIRNTDTKITSTPET